MALRPDQRRASLAVLDANVLYSQVLTDYFVHAQSQNLINLRWSSRILDEMIRNKKARAAEKFKDPVQLAPRLAAADDLRAYVERTYPDQLLEPSDEDYLPFDQLEMPDPDDRHVVATAVAAGATYLCTDNMPDFPPAVMTHLGIRRVTSDALLVELGTKHPLEMIRAHQQVIAWTPRATHQTTLDALDRARAPMFKATMERLLTSLGDVDSRDDLAQVYVSAIAELDRARAGLLPPSNRRPRPEELAARPADFRGRERAGHQRGIGG